MNKEMLKKIGKIAGDILFAVFMVFVLFIAIINLKAKQANNIPNLFGTGYVSVESDSMNGDQEDSFETGDLIVVEVIGDKNYDQVKTLEKGQIITYYDYSEEKIISHRIINVLNEGSNFPTYVVKGDNPQIAYDDTTNVACNEVLAIYKNKVSGVGSIMKWFSTGIGFFIIVVLPCILFLVYEVYKFIKVLVAYQNEKNGEFNQEKSNEQLLKLRREALDALVKDGTISQEQADNKYAEYEASLNTPVEETTNTEESK